MSDVEAVTDPCTYHGEGAVWARWADGEPPALKFVDMLAGDVLTLDADGRVAREHVGAVAAVVRPRTGGGCVVAVERGFALVDTDGAQRSLGSLWDDADVRMNEGGCDPYGRFHCGSMATSDAARGQAAAGRLYRLDTDGAVTVVAGGMTVPNGFGFSPDGSTLYHVDTPTRAVRAYDYEREGPLGDPRVLLTVPEEHGMPDGLTVDAEGHLWVAMYGGHAVRRYTPGGQECGAVTVPVSQVTSCAFGGADLDELYVTTSRENLPDDAEPDAGTVYRARPGVRGLPALPFAG